MSELAITAAVITLGIVFTLSLVGVLLYVLLSMGGDKLK